MKHWSFYKSATGLFTGGIFSSDDYESIKMNTPSDCVAIEGHYDHLSQRVDLAALRLIAELDPEKDADRIAELQSRLVYDYQPLQPDDDHEWNADIKRWQIKPDIASKRQAIAEAQKEIDRMERLQLRAVRELSINRGNDEALRRLQEIDDQIALQRQLIALNK